MGFKVLFQLQYLSIQKHVYLNLTVEITVDIARLVKRSFWGEELFSLLKIKPIIRVNFQYIPSLLYSHKGHYALTIINYETTLIFCQLERNCFSLQNFCCNCDGNVGWILIVIEVSLLYMHISSLIPIAIWTLDSGCSLIQGFNINKIEVNCSRNNEPLVMVLTSGMDLRSVYVS